MLDIIKSPEFGAFVSNMLITLVAFLVPLIGGAVRGFIKSKASDTQFQTLMAIAKTAVLAAEQAGLAGVVGDKKASALKAAQAMLKDRGLSVDIVALDAAIEAAVATELNSYAINEAAYAKTGGAA